MPGITALVVAGEPNGFAASEVEDAIVVAEASFPSAVAPVLAAAAAVESSSELLLSSAAGL
jgi:hypothetical protein